MFITVVCVFFSFLIAENLEGKKVQVVSNITKTLNVPRILNLGLLNLGFLSLDQTFFSFDNENQHKSLFFFFALLQKRFYFALSILRDLKSLTVTKW